MEEHVSSSLMMTTVADSMMTTANAFKLNNSAQAILECSILLKINQANQDPNLESSVNC